MTTDEAESVHKKQVCEQHQEEEDPTAQEPGPPHTAQDSPSGTSLPPGGSEEEQQLKPRQRTSAGRGLSRLFSSFLKHRSQCSEGEGVETERAQDEGCHEPKAPIADPEPELRLEGDVALDQHSISSAENQKHAKGQDLFAKVCDHLNLLEKDYYGLAIWETPSIKKWLDFTKEIRRQVQGTNYDFTFNVKFYPPDPAQLSEDLTRYYLCLQLRKDIKSGRLPCSFVTLALLGSYALQSELGEYDPEVHGTDYAKDLQLIPGQTKELEEKVMELHRTYRSMSPAQADMMFLENAKKLAMYGVDLHQAKVQLICNYFFQDLDGVDIMLGVCSSGLMVYKEKLRINRFPWPKVLKVSYKRSSFFIKIRPSDLEHYESAIGFKLPNYTAAKKLWKVCVEHHTFFRLVSTEAATTPRKFLALGSKFRFSGRTQAQTRQASSMIDRPAPRFQRSASKRASRSLDGAMVSTPDKKTRPVSAPIMSPIFLGDAAPSPVVPSAARTDRKETSTPTGRPRSTERKSEMKAEAHVTDSSKTHSTKAEGTPEIKTVARRERRHRDAQVVTAINGERKSQSPRAGTELVRMRKKRAKQIEGETIYIRHSNLMLEDVEKTQTEIMRHHTSISELKRSFMESAPVPRPSEWDKRLSTHSPFRTASFNGQMQPDSPVVKTKTITISDVTNSLRGEIANTDIPIVHTETKTITYESAQTNAVSEKESGMLLSAQTITSETVSTTTTTQITKTVKGGISETRIEKRIVITGDTEIDHDKALAQAIKEAKEQHPDMSVTKVVVHQETEITPE
ncbi:Protein 4.1 [Triplophysa tibetana]|uniref:Protein 4.1 n=1 Tax=Triplophysa tibetana TaxID=1572043 RepID=A0A5A9NML4_9TELE|nr:Protein 4.1 [Triplophysa tibetana]